MKVIKPSSKEEFAKIIEEAKRDGKLIYISAYPCPECEQFEAALEELGLSNSDKIIKVDVPNEDWAIDFVLNELKITGAPTVIGNNIIIDDPDPIEMALKVKKLLEEGNL